MTRRPNRRNQEGQALVEFALAIPIFMLLLLGIFQFGIAYHNYLQLTDAVRVGAREAAVSRTLPDPVAAATDRMMRSATGLDTNDLTVSVVPFDPGTNTSTWVQGGDVTVTGTYPFRISLIGLVLFDGTLTSRTTERVE